MFVIVEGIDRVGKTTLCNMLEKNGFITLKDAFGQLYDTSDAEFPFFSVGKLDTAIQYIKKLCDKGFNIVADRLHITEFVYGTIDRGTAPDLDAIKKLDEEISSMFGFDVTLILVTPTDVDEASERACHDLTFHDTLFTHFFEASTIKRKLKTDFFHLNDAVKAIVARAFTYDFYFASPFFRPDQVEREERLKTHLRLLGYRVFSPKESCHLESTADPDSQDAVFNDNVESIKKSAAVFAITDTKDMGTIWEAGYAYGVGKPIIYYAETLGENLFNLMLAKSGRTVCKSQDEVTKELLDAVLYKGEGTIFGGQIE